MIERLDRPVLDRALGYSVGPALDRLGVKQGEEFYVTTTATTAVARRSDPDTSKAAAQSVEDLRESQKAVYRAFELRRATAYGVGREGLTDEELIESYEFAVTNGYVRRQSHSGLRTRRRELVDAGLLEDSGDRREISTGRKAIVWRIPEPPELGPNEQGSLL